MKILYLEDEENARIGLSALLRSRGHVVDECSSSLDAVQRLTLDVYQLFLIDVMSSEELSLPGVVPRQSGKVLIERLRRGEFGQTATSRNVAVVAITAVSDVDVIRVLCDLDCTIVQKPTSPEACVDAIEQKAMDV